MKNIFSTITNICTDSHYNLGKDATKGHATTTNVFTETISIRSNLLDIPIHKINIFGKKLACYEWESIKCVLALAKPATYKNLQARKKQQAVANENL